MVLAAVYAVLVWLFAMRWRRQWEGFAAVAAGGGLLIAADIILTRLGAPRVRPPDAHSVLSLLHSEPMVVLLRPYTALVAGVGVYIAFLPRRAPSEAHCPGCHYDLTGLDPRGLVCPECGMAQQYRCLACGHSFGDAEPVGLACPDCSTPWAGPGAEGAAAAAPCEDAA